MQITKLRQCIYGMYPSEAEFSRTLGWTRQRLHKITSGEKQPSLLEAYDIATGLGISVDQMVHFFIPVESPIEHHHKEEIA